MKENKTQLENQKRLDFLYRNHHSWLMACGFNISRNVEISEDLVSDLYLYLAEKCSPKLWFLESFNLLYCHSFLKTRYINKIKINNRFNPISDTYDVEDTPYDRDFDENMETAYKEIITQFSELQKTPLWASAKLAEMYYLNPKNTFDSLATEIGISKSTVFLNVRKIKNHLQETITSPFKNEKSYKKRISEK